MIARLRRFANPSFETGRMGYRLANSAAAILPRITKFGSASLPQ
jgi:hypothetical protein